MWDARALKRRCLTQEQQLGLRLLTGFVCMLDDRVTVAETRDSDSLRGIGRTCGFKPNGSRIGGETNLVSSAQEQSPPLKLSVFAHVCHWDRMRGSLEPHLER